MKKTVQSILVVLGVLFVMGAVFFTVGFVLPWFFAMLLEVPWVASSILFVAFIVILIKLPRRGWSPEGTLLLIGVVLAGTVVDSASNPVFNAPYEALFLESDQRLQGGAAVESIGGEVHVSGVVGVVDSDGRHVSTPNMFLLALYRAVIYFAFYSVLLTISGLFPNRRDTAKADPALSAE